MNPVANEVKAIFDSVIDLPTPTAREAKLNAACSGNPELRAKVQALLEAFDKRAASSKPHRQE